MYTGPNIITNGLVLQLDAANTKSYPGSGTLWNDLSGNNNNGSLVNGPTFSSQNSGGLTFNGTNQYVNLGNVSLLNFNRLNPYTLSVIFTSTNVTNPYVILGKMNNATIQGYTIFINGRSIYTDLGNFTGLNYIQVNSLPILNINTIYNVVATYDGSSIAAGLKIYLNSSLLPVTVVNNGLTVDFTNTAPFYIAGRDPSAYLLPGNVYNTQVYNRALSAPEILQNYNATKTRFGIA